MKPTLPQVPGLARFAASLRVRLRSLRRLSGWVALASAASTCLAADKPNILWLVSEDNHLFLGCYGDPLAKTPTLDKLAREGVLYERCFAQPVCAPSRFMLITGMSPTTCGPAQHMRAEGKIPEWLKGFPAYLRQAGYFTSNNSKTDYNAPIDTGEAWNECGTTAHYRNRTERQPFFSVFNHTITHESGLFPLDEPTIVDPAAVRLPPYQPDTPEIRADWARYYTRINAMDEQIAEKLRELESEGLADDTIIFYYSDNGGVLPRSKRFLHTSGTQVPLIVRFPPKWRHLAPAAPGSRIKDPVGFLDFAPTVLNLAGIEKPEHMQGRAFAGPSRPAPNEHVFCSRDRMDQRYDMSRSVVGRRWLYIRNYRPDLPYVPRLEYMFQARGYQSWARLAAAGKLTPASSRFWGPKPTEELYDIDNDTDNIRNLAGDPEHRGTLERMRHALSGHLVANFDNGFLPEGSALEGYAASRAPGAFPVERVLAMADLASSRDPDKLPDLVAGLEDPCEPIRWWAAQGCAMLGRKALPAEKALRRLLEDPSGSVQVAAAEAMTRIGMTDAALPVLERCLKADGPVGLQAGNVLERLGEAARPALGSMKEALKSASNDERSSPRRVLESTIAVLEGREEALVYPQPPP